MAEWELAGNGDVAASGPESGPILRMEVRAGYPNPRRLSSGLERRARPGKSERPDLPGYAPPVVTCERETWGRRETVEFPVREIDLPILRRPDTEEARAHAALILRARGGCRDSGRRLEETRERRARSILSVPGSPFPSKDRFIVPSTGDEAPSADEVGDKGAMLLALSRLGYPVPDFVVITSEAYSEWDRRRPEIIERASRGLAALTGQALGGREDPLVLALRCCLPFYAPGLLPTYLNVGITAGVAPALARVFGPVAAERMRLNNLRNLLRLVDPEGYEAVKNIFKPIQDPDEVRRLVERLSGLVGAKDAGLVEDPFRQLAFFAGRAYGFFDENRDVFRTLSRGKPCRPALILQKMVCTVRDEESCAGVLRSRHPKTGRGYQLETGQNVFGEEIMTGSLAPTEYDFEKEGDIRASHPAVFHFIGKMRELERRLEAPVTAEFAVEAASGCRLFALLQVNPTALSGRAAFISAVDLHKEGAISRKRVTEIICPYHVKQIESDAIDFGSLKNIDPFGRGISVLPRSAVTARIYFSSEAALNAKKEGEKVCLCKETFDPDDTAVMREMDGIVGLTSAAIHVVTACQSFGMPVLLALGKSGCAFDGSGGLRSAGGKILREGDWVTLSSRRQALFAGRAAYEPARLMRYLKGEPVTLAEGEKDAFEEMAYAYRYYQQLLKGLKLHQTLDLNALIRLVNLELRGRKDEARSLVRAWFDGHKSAYVEEVLKSDLGDHLNQNALFDMLTPDRKIRFFKDALARCDRAELSGFTAGAFMLGRFISRPQPAAFWGAFTSREAGLLVNEWLLFEKYMRVLHEVGERKIVRAKKKVLEDGLGPMPLEPRTVRDLVGLKLCGADLGKIGTSIPAWADPQTRDVIEVLGRPYGDFYDYDAEWSRGELEKLCRAAGRALPRPDER
jgi:hypothetical protein